jgi:hypothetical protein
VQGERGLAIVVAPGSCGLRPVWPAHRKLGAVRAGARPAFPSADIEQMLEEIERGYRSGEPG